MKPEDVGWLIAFIILGAIFIPGFFLFAFAGVVCVVVGFVIIILILKFLFGNDR